MRARADSCEALIPASAAGRPGVRTTIQVNGCLTSPRTTNSSSNSPTSPSCTTTKFADCSRLWNARTSCCAVAGSSELVQMCWRITCSIWRRSTTLAGPLDLSIGWSRHFRPRWRTSSPTRQNSIGAPRPLMAPIPFFGQCGAICSICCQQPPIGSERTS